MTITIYNKITHRRFVISGYNSNDVQIVKIDFYPSFQNVFKIYYLYDDLQWYFIHHFKKHYLISTKFSKKWVFDSFFIHVFIGL